MNDKQFQGLNCQDSVLNFQNINDMIIVAHPMFKMGDFIEEAQRHLVRKDVHLANRWFVDGIDFELLGIGGKKWQKGKMRLKLTVEFCPDEPTADPLESPLDDIRQMLNGNAQ